MHPADGYNITLVTRRLLGSEIVQAKISSKAIVQMSKTQKNLPLSLHEMILTAAHGISEHCPYTFQHENEYYVALLTRRSFSIVTLGESFENRTVNC